MKYYFDILLFVSILIDSSNLFKFLIHQESKNLYNTNFQCDKMLNTKEEEISAS